ncbi:VgrG-related protein [Nakamurella multipartita]|jgi:phage protein D|uniref:Rhs element Vgr protein n=1 Tax=Nakamurella multipartita (strain ATCC 700099 / DSM 44233 / CIP 104796 / JCM 9543 / NBRC 105858 / Y-104) TaxID=479431 RepID=C8XH89_NAKMY|nr:VgrG-related protein [Nakamurella multipartita]ACV78295.1 Rhs element Vgr protein [Nakamurella multipartita DSM 44233]HOZ56797.1 VgrG-related protein [Nakamurella multipartita]
MAPTSSSFLVDIDGSPLAADAKALLVSAIVDDSLRLPDFFLLRFRDPDRLVITKSGAKIGSKVKVSVATDAAPSPLPLIEGEITALEAEYDATGTYTVIRGYDQANRLFRGRRTESYTQSTASDVATKVAQRAGLSIGEVESTSTVYEHLSQGGVTDWEFLDGLAREIGYEIAVKDGKFDFRKPKKADTAPAGGGGPEQQNPLVLRLGTDLLRFRSLITAAEQVKEVQARGWDLAQKKAFVATAPAATTSAVLPAYNPVDIAKKFGDPVYVATDVAYRSQAEVDSAAAAIAEQIAGAFAEFEGVARGNPKLHAGAAISVDNVGAPFDGKYTITSSHHRYDPNTGYTTMFSVTGRSERSLYGLANGGGGGKLGQGPVVAQVSDAKDPLEQGRVKLTFPWLSDTYVSDWARTVQPGAGKDRGALVLPEVGDEVLVLFEQGDIRRPYVLGGLFNGVDTAPKGKPDLIDGSSGAINRRSFVSRRGHRIDLIDEDGRTEGITLSTTGDKLQLKLDSVETKITVHSDGKILIEGKGGVLIDSASSKLELKGGEVSITSTSGVKIDGGSGGVDVQTNGQLSLKGSTAKLEGQASAEVKASGVLTVQGSLVKIN